YKTGPRTEERGHGVLPAGFRPVCDASDLREEAGRLLHDRRCSDRDRGTAAAGPDLCPHCQSEAEGKTHMPRRFLVGILCACVDTDHSSETVHLKDIYGFDRKIRA